jgi:hypothetical protein
MRKVTKQWTMRNGTKIRICDMDDDHLNNSIRMMERKSEFIKAETPYPFLSGEMAQYAAESEFDFIQTASPEFFFPILTDMRNEKKRREECLR